MKSRAICFIQLSVVAVWIASIGIASAQTELIKFDNFSPGIPGAQIPNSYAGLQWSNFYVLNALTENSVYGDDGYVNGMVSSPNVAYNSFGTNASISISSGSFNLNSAYLAGAWNDGLQVQAEGFVGNTLTYNNTYTVNSLGPTLINFDYLGVDEVMFISFGGTPHGYPSNGSGTHFVMDNLSVTLVPEPSVPSLGAVAGIVLALRFVVPRWSQRRRNGGHVSSLIA